MTIHDALEAVEKVQAHYDDIALSSAVRQFLNTAIQRVRNELVAADKPQK